MMIYFLWQPKYAENKGGFAYNTFWYVFVLKKYDKNQNQDFIRTKFDNHNQNGNQNQ